MVEIESSTLATESLSLPIFQEYPSKKSCLLAGAMGEINQCDGMLEKLLECPVCLEIRDCLILQCSTGHHICMFCKDNLQVCPLCNGKFLQTRNFLAENLANKLGDIQKEIENVKLKGKREIANMSTQTDFEISKSCSGTQTVEMACINVMEKRKDEGTARSVPSYPCHIGSCMFKSSYQGLVQHLLEYHKDTFYEVHEIYGGFTEKCVLDTNAVPRYYNFAFLTNSMGLFFFNIAVHGNGRLKARVLHTNKSEMSEPFHYNLAIKNKVHQLTRHGKVVPCGSSKEMVSMYSVSIENKYLLRIMNAKFFECTITITTCACNQFKS